MDNNDKTASVVRSDALQRLLVLWHDDATREPAGTWMRTLLEKHIKELETVINEANAELTGSKQPGKGQDEI